MMAQTAISEGKLIEAFTKIHYFTALACKLDYEYRTRDSGYYKFSLIDTLKLLYQEIKELADAFDISLYDACRSPSSGSPTKSLGLKIAYSRAYELARKVNNIQRLVDVLAHKETSTAVILRAFNDFLEFAHFFNCDRNLFLDKNTTFA